MTSRSGHSGTCPDTDGDLRTILLRKFTDEFYSNFFFVVAFVSEIDTCGEVKHCKLFPNMKMLLSFFVLFSQFLAIKVK